MNMKYRDFQFYKSEYFFFYNVSKWLRLGSEFEQPWIKTKYFSSNQIGPGSVSSQTRSGSKWTKSAILYSSVHTVQIQCPQCTNTEYKLQKYSVHTVHSVHTVRIVYTLYKGCYLCVEREDGLDGNIGAVEAVLLKHNLQIKKFT